MSKLGWTLMDQEAGSENVLELSAGRDRSARPAAPDLLEPVLFARVIEALETERFFEALRDFINAAVQIDNCVALAFSADTPPLILHQWSPQEPN